MLSAFFQSDFIKNFSKMVRSKCLADLGLHFYFAEFVLIITENAEFRKLLHTKAAGCLRKIFPFLKVNSIVRICLKAT